MAQDKVTSAKRKGVRTNETSTNVSMHERNKTIANGDTRRKRTIKEETGNEQDKRREKGKQNGPKKTTS